MIIICCGILVKRIGILGVGVRKIQALNVKLETVTLIAKGLRHVQKLKIQRS
jgi:hypothetical protein